MRIVSLALASAALFSLGMNPVLAGPPTKKPAKKTTSKKAAKKEKWVTTKSGLQYMDVKIGKGPMPKKGQTAIVNYIGRLPNGTKFDSSYDHGQPFPFTIGKGEVIKGWDEGVATMRVGGKRALIVPPQLGYGPRSMGPIPANATLLFQVELLAVK